MKILVVGSGGREHAIIRKLKQSPKAEKIYCCPGNGGISADAECVDIKAMDIDGVVRFSKENAIDLVVVAPDDPLAAGMVDALNEAGVLADILPLQKASADILARYPLVILPQTEHLSDTFCDTLREYCRNGGILFAQCRLNRLDEFGKYRMEAAPGTILRELFGLRVDESCEIRRAVDFREFEYNGRTVPPDNRMLEVSLFGETAGLLSFMERPVPEGCRVLQEYSAGVYQGAPLFTVCGNAWYLAAPMDRRGLALVVKRLLKQARIPCRKVPPKCRRIRRGNMVFYLNPTPETVCFPDDGITLSPRECRCVPDCDAGPHAPPDREGGAFV